MCVCFGSKHIKERIVQMVFRKEGIASARAIIGCEESLKRNCFKYLGIHL
jgi:hypothetical protein